MSLALILAVENIKYEMDNSAETIQTVPLSPIEYLIIWETGSRYVYSVYQVAVAESSTPSQRRYGITVRILDDVPRALVTSVRPKLELGVQSALVPVIKSVTAVKPAKMEAIFQKSRSEAVEGFKQNDQQNGHENPGIEAGSTSFVSLDKGLGMLVEGKWLGPFVGRAVRNLIQMARSDGS